MSPLDIVLIVAGVGYVLARRMIGQPLEAKSLLAPAVVLSVVGAFDVRDARPMDATTVALIGASCLLSVTIGLVRGGTVHLSERDGALWMRYRAVTVLLWLINLAVKAAMIPVERSVSSASAHAAGKGLMLSLGLGVLAETLVVLLRALHSGSAVVWQSAQGGASHRTGQGFGRARR